jgi:hypothetical protein
MVAPTGRIQSGILAGSSDVFVAGYQTIRGMASDFSARLDYIRPNTSLLDERNGTFSELLAARKKSPCLTLFEMRRYTSLSHELSRAAVDAGIALIIICDNHCYWARDYNENVLRLSTDSHLFWDSQVSFLSLTNLLLDDIVARLGKKVAGSRSCPNFRTALEPSEIEVRDCSTSISRERNSRLHCQRFPTKSRSQKQGPFRSVAVCPHLAPTETPLCQHRPSHGPDFVGSRRSSIENS